MRFFIYELNQCKICLQREPLHEQLASLLKSVGIPTIVVTIGNVDGDNYYPLSEHDTYCRKPNNAASYVAPVYILETNESVVKMPDISAYASMKDYAQYVMSVLQQLQS